MFLQLTELPANEKREHPGDEENEDVDALWQNMETVNDQDSKPEKPKSKKKKR